MCGCCSCCCRCCCLCYVAIVDVFSCCCLFVVFVPVLLMLLFLCFFISCLFCGGYLLIVVDCCCSSAPFCGCRGCFCAFVLVLRVLFLLVCVSLASDTPEKNTISLQFHRVLPLLSPKTPFFNILLFAMPFVSPLYSG